MAPVQTRPATLEDVAVVTALVRRFDMQWFGAPEHDEGELREELERVRALAAHSRLAFDGGALLGAAWWWGTDSALVVDPAAGPEVTDALLDWYDAGAAPQLSVLGRDERLRAAVSNRGWRHEHSGFELVREVTADWILDPPVWPVGVVVHDLRPDDAAALHHLVYTEARWSDVPGHVTRGFDEWRSIFLTDAATPDQQVLAWRGRRLVGAALGRFFSDGTGWIAQLAVAADERGLGLGRALLLEALRRRRAAGAKALGLGVEAANASALRLYLGVGLHVVREWQTFVRPEN